MLFSLRRFFVLLLICCLIIQSSIAYRIPLVIIEPYSYGIQFIVSPHNFPSSSTSLPPDSSLTPSTNETKKLNETETTSLVFLIDTASPESTAFEKLNFDLVPSETTLEQADGFIENPKYRFPIYKSKDDLLLVDSVQIAWETIGLASIEYVKGDGNE